MIILLDLNSQIVLDTQSLVCPLFRLKVNSGATKKFSKIVKGIVPEVFLFLTLN